MTVKIVPRIVACKCGHTSAAHTPGARPECRRPGCGCLTYRPKGARS